MDQWLKRSARGGSNAGSNPVAGNNFGFFFFVTFFKFFSKNVEKKCMQIGEICRENAKKS